MKFKTPKEDLSLHILAKVKDYFDRMNNFETVSQKNAWIGESAACWQRECHVTEHPTYKRLEATIVLAPLFTRPMSLSLFDVLVQYPLTNIW